MSLPYFSVPIFGITNGIAASAVVVLAYWGADMSLFEAVALGCIELVGFELLIGRDTTYAEAFPPVLGFASEDTQKALVDGREAIQRLHRTIHQFGHTEQAQRLTDFAKEADKVVRQLELDPKKLPNARPFLDTYLAGVAVSAEKYAHLYERSSNEEQQIAFKQVLVEAKAVAVKQQKALIADDEADLDLDIKVLQLHTRKDLR